MKDTLPQLEGGRIILRLAERDDSPAILYYYTKNRTYLKPFEPNRPVDFYTESYWINEINYGLDSFKKGLSLKLFIFDKDIPKAIIGSVNFSHFIRGTFQSCTLGYSLAEAQQGKGYMTEALKIAIGYVFDELNLHRIMAAYMPHNQKSGRLLKRLGFVVEGYARDYLMINGQWEDHILTSLINHNWKLL